MNTEFKDLFLDFKHRRHFEDMMKVNNASYNDRERVALFYVLSSIDKFRDSVESYYSFQKGEISSLDKLIADKKLTLSDGEQSLLELAYHLFTGRDDYKATAVNTFNNLGDEWSYIALNAIKLRFSLENIDKKVGEIN